MNIPETFKTWLSYKFAIAFLLLISIALVLGFLSVWNLYFIGTDGTAYATLGKNIAEGTGLRLCGSKHTFYPPGYPLAIGFFYLFLRNAELSGHLVSCFAYVTTAALTFFLAWRMRPSLLFATLSAAIVVLHPSLREYGSVVMAEGLFVCIVIAIALCCWLLAQRNPTPLWLWGVWGALVGYAYLIRADGIVYGPLQAFFIFICGQENRRRMLPKSFLALAALLIVMGPYLFFIRDTTGKWQLSSKTSIILEYARTQMVAQGGRAESQQTSQLSKDGKSFTIDLAKDTLGAYLLREPQDALRRVLHYSRQLITKPGINFGWIHGIFLAILLLGQGRRIFNRKALFIVLHLLPIGLFLILFVDIRFLLAFIPFFALGIARALEQVWEWVLTYGRKPFPLYVSLILLCVGFLGGSLVGHKIVNRVTTKLHTLSAKGKDLPLEHKAMGLWMKQNLEITSTTRITHRNPWVSFYADACHSRTPFTDDLNVLVNWAKETNVEYVIVDQRMTKPYMPGLAFLLDDTKPYPGLKHLHTIENPKIVLYRVE